MARTRVPDETDRRIIKVLEKDARASYNAIARELGLSVPTIAHRVKRLEDVGIIVGYRVELREPAPDTRRHTKNNLKCANCKGPVRGPALTRLLGGRHYPFCCKVCEADFVKRWRRVTPE